MTQATLIKVEFSSDDPFKRVSHWEMLLNDDLFGRYQTKADAIADAKHYSFEITHINGRKVRLSDG